MADKIPPDPPDPPDKIIPQTHNKTPNIEENSQKQTDNKIKKLYSEHDFGPFEVYIQSKEKNVGNFHILSIAKEIFNLKLNDIIKINRKGKNRLGVYFTNYKAANNLVNDKRLEEKKYDIFIPTHLVSCRGIVRWVDKELSEEELKQYTETKMNHCKILQIRRLSRKHEEGNQVKYIPTSTVCFTFSGKSIPKEIEIYGLPMKVTPYVSPVLQCQNCLLYGHNHNQCKGNTKCRTCGSTQDHHDEKKCEIFCIHCKSSLHNSMNKNCREFARQKEIKQLMSFSNLSYYEANTQLQQTVSKEFNTNLQNFPPISKSNNDNSITIQERRVKAMEGNVIPTYSQSIRSPSTPKRKRPASSNQGYDQKAYNEMLNCPNGRSRNPTPTPTQNRDSHQRLDMDYQQAMSILSPGHRDLVMSFIGNLINSSYMLQDHNISHIVEIDSTQISSASNAIQSPTAEGRMAWSDESDQCY